MLPDPRRDRRPRRSSLRLALRARLRENPRDKPNQEVTTLPEACAARYLADERNPLHHYIRLDFPPSVASEPITDPRARPRRCGRVGTRDRATAT